jgi:hypothetical protein
MVNPPSYEAFGFRRNGPLFSLVRIPIPFGKGKLAQEGSAFARKRNAAIFLAPAREFRPWRLDAAVRQPLNSRILA